MPARRKPEVPPQPCMAAMGRLRGRAVAQGSDASACARTSSISAASSARSAGAASVCGRRNRPRAQRDVVRDRQRRHRRRTVGVHGRLSALEAEAHENRQLNRRIAELTDVVAELLVPLADRDEEGSREVLARYRTEL